jgi:hypothetical protein
VWQQIVADGVTLITNDEASDSNVSKEEAEEVTDYFFFDAISLRMLLVLVFDGHRAA